MISSSDERREIKGGGASAGSKSVESSHVMGTKESVTAAGAEGFSDDASSKANRKEAGEPQREAAEKSAVTKNEVKHSGTIGGGSGGECAHKNVIGHGQRETVAKNCM